MKELPCVATIAHATVLVHRLPRFLQKDLDKSCISLLAGAVVAALSIFMAHDGQTGSTHDRLNQT
jgi:hypothetical protein